MFDRKHKYSCTTCGIRRVTLVKDPTMNHVKGQEFYNIQNTNVYIKFRAHDAYLDTSLVICNREDSKR